MFSLVIDVLNNTHDVVELLCRFTPAMDCCESYWKHPFNETVNKYRHNDGFYFSLVNGTEGESKGCFLYGRMVVELFVDGRREGGIEVFRSCCVEIVIIVKCFELLYLFWRSQMINLRIISLHFVMFVCLIGRGSVAEMCLVVKEEWINCQFS